VVQHKAPGAVVGQTKEKPCLASAKQGLIALYYARPVIRSTQTGVRRNISHMGIIMRPRPEEKRMFVPLLFCVVRYHIGIFK